MTPEQTKKVSDVLDEVFAFEIGETVANAQFVVELDATLRFANKGLYPIARVVTSRWIEQCHGGAQAHYGLDDGRRVPEFCLMSWQHAIAHLDTAHAESREGSTGDTGDIRRELQELSDLILHHTHK